MNKTKRATSIMVPVLLLISCAFLSTIVVGYLNVQNASQASHSINSKTMQGRLSIKEHKTTTTELDVLKQTYGTLKDGASYNKMVDGYGTGLKPPTEEQWNQIATTSYTIDSVSSLSTPSNFDNSKLPYFPPIGNQGSQNCCGSWSLGYYIATFQIARDSGWDLSGATMSGGQPTPSYQSEIMSPAFVYNLINNGTDSGQTWYDAAQLICNIGVSSWATMPYNQNNATWWPSESAWREAPLYRGASSGYQYLSLNSAAGINSLKSLLASENLVSIAVDAGKFPSLSSNDVWTLDNYVSTNPSHAGTVVGYDDNFSYTESGQTTYGAFKVANSWGIGSWEPVQTGYYWISYDAMMQRISGCCYFGSNPNYQPTLLTTFNLADNARANCQITVGLGSPSKPIITKCFNNFVKGGSQPFCTNNIVMDITEFTNAVPSLNNQTLYLQVTDLQKSPTNGTINYFAVGNTAASGVPCPTIPNNSVFLSVVPNPYVDATITLLPAGPSIPLSPTDYFQISYFQSNQPQVAYAKDGTLTLTTDGNTKLTMFGISSMSTSSEQWVLSQQPIITFPTATNNTFYYYDLLSQQVAYNCSNTGAIAPELVYYTAPSTASQVLNQTAVSILLPSNSSQRIFALRGATATVNSTISISSKEQWAAPTYSWNITQTNLIPNSIIYTHRYQVTAAYATSDNSTMTSPPMFFGTQFGANCSMPLTISNQSFWIDENGPYSIQQTTVSSSGNERWITTPVSGTVTAPFSFGQTYTHQYYLAILPTLGSVQGSGWYNSGTIANVSVTTPFSPTQDTQYLFNSWNGTGSGAYNGNATSYSLTINSLITETANYITQYYLTVNNDGYGTTQGSGWYNSGTSAQAAISPTAVQGSSGTQYLFNGWTGDASDSTSTCTIQMTSPKTVTASWVAQQPTPSIQPTPTSSSVSTPTRSPISAPTSTQIPTPTSTQTQNPTHVTTPITPEYPIGLLATILFIVVVTATLVLHRKSVQFIPTNWKNSKS